jgi:L-aminopeptidase/D-esterase-like protein
MVARAATAGIARAVDPTFTPVDGDVAFCLASGKAGETRPFISLQIGVAAATVTAAAIRDAVRQAA